MVLDNTCFIDRGTKGTTQVKYDTSEKGAIIEFSLKDVDYSYGIISVLPQRMQKIYQRDIKTIFCPLNVALYCRGKISSKKRMEHDFIQLGFEDDDIEQVYTTLGTETSIINAYRFSRELAVALFNEEIGCDEMRVGLEMIIEDRNEEMLKTGILKFEKSQKS